MTRPIPLQPAPRKGEDRASDPAIWTNVLAEVPLFSSLSRRHIRKVAGIGRIARFHNATAIIRAGDPGDSFYVVIDGEVSVRRRGSRPSRSVRAASSARWPSSTEEPASRPSWRRGLSRASPSPARGSSSSCAMSPRSRSGSSKRSREGCGLCRLRLSDERERRVAEVGDPDLPAFRRDRDRRRADRPGGQPPPGPQIESGELTDRAATVVDRPEPTARHRDPRGRERRAAIGGEDVPHGRERGRSRRRGARAAAPIRRDQVPGSSSSARWSPGCCEGPRERATRCLPPKPSPGQPPRLTRRQPGCGRRQPATEGRAWPGGFPASRSSSPRRSRNPQRGRLRCPAAAPGAHDRAEGRRR